MTTKWKADVSPDGAEHDVRKRCRRIRAPSGSQGEAPQNISVAPSTNPDPMPVSDAPGDHQTCERINELDAQARGPKFGIGQSVMQWWASWMRDAETPPASQQKIYRPHWYRGEIFSHAEWKVDYRYAGVLHTSYVYSVGDWCGRHEMAPEKFLRSLPPSMIGR